MTASEDSSATFPPDKSASEMKRVHYTKLIINTISTDIKMKVNIFPVHTVQHKILYYTKQAWKCMFKRKPEIWTSQYLCTEKIYINCLKSGKAWTFSCLWILNDVIDISILDWGGYLPYLSHSVHWCQLIMGRVTLLRKHVFPPNDQGLITVHKYSAYHLCTRLNHCAERVG